MSNEKIKDWYKRKGESSAAYEAFTTYLELQDRSYAKVARKLRKSDTIIRRWAKAYDWENRATMWDNSIVEEARKAAIRDFKKMIELQIGLGKMLQAKSAKAIQSMEFDKVPMKYLPAMVKMLETGVSIERSSRSIEEDYNNKSKNDKLNINLNLDFSKLSDGELNELDKLLSKLQGINAADS